MSYMASKRHKQSEQRILLESKLANLEKSYILSPNPVLLEDLTATRTALNTLLLQYSENSLRFARQRIYECGDKPGRLLANLAKKRTESLNITSITDANNVRSFDTRTINKEFVTFYSNLYCVFTNHFKH